MHCRLHWAGRERGEKHVRPEASAWSTCHLPWFRLLGALAPGSLWMFGFADRFCHSFMPFLASFNVASVVSTHWCPRLMPPANLGPSLMEGSLFLPPNSTFYLGHQHLPTHVYLSGCS
ncbi:hypothetical protein N658DRAFT_124917 [Parathielavia hyrcaniae]|uniref:Uncharacterized protein n=1 Tax=Parathielavia hyrcaniae TaxID=113614 RepID=A0AAN6QE84_9PEZI|nr:hypothetical protein N658DRAFT_124917 [Parathielavia hyrcaniae]